MIIAHHTKNSTFGKPRYRSLIYKGIDTEAFCVCVGV
nr:MAG TPA: hypothetical protein [Crassvirales sp.]